MLFVQLIIYWKSVNNIIFVNNNIKTSIGRINSLLFSIVLPSNSGLFLSCGPFVVITFSTSTRPIENVVTTTKGLQDRNNLL